MKTILWLILLASHILYSQVCLIDGKDMFSIGSSEIVNGEHLSLFCCDDGHQMWLANYDQHNKIKKMIELLVIPLGSLFMFTYFRRKQPTVYEDGN